MHCTFTVTLYFHSTSFLKANIEISTVYLITLVLRYFADIRLHQSESIAFFKSITFYQKKETKRKKKLVKAEYRIQFVLLMYKQTCKYLCNLLFKSDFKFI